MAPGRPGRDSREGANEMTEATLTRIENNYGEYVANVYANYGATLTPGLAESLARQHGTSLADLVAECGLRIKAETVKTLEIFRALGY